MLAESECGCKVRGSWKAGAGYWTSRVSMALFWTCHGNAENYWRLDSGNRKRARIFVIFCISHKTDIILFASSAKRASELNFFVQTLRGRSFEAASSAAGGKTALVGNVSVQVAPGMGNMVLGIHGFLYVIIASCYPCTSGKEDIYGVLIGRKKTSKIRRP